PLASLNHFTVPCAIRPFLSIRRRGDLRRLRSAERPAWSRSPRSSAETPAPTAGTLRLRQKKDAARSRSRDVVFRQRERLPVRQLQGGDPALHRRGATLQRRKKVCQDT